VSQTTGNFLNREREILALEALHHLSVQFAANQNFPKIVRLLLFTLSGQFGVPGLIAALHKPGAGRTQSFTVAVGPFQQSPESGDCPVDVQCWNCLSRNNEPCRSSRQSESDGETAGRHCLRQVYSLSVVVPLIEKQTVFGFIGLGRKHTGACLNHEEVELLQAIVDTVTPLLLNSFLLTDVQATKQWHESLLDSVPLAVLVCDSNGRLRLLNRAAAAIVSEPVPCRTGPGGDMPPVLDVLKDIEMPDQVRHYLAAPGPSCPRSCTVVERHTGRVFNVSISRVFNESQGAFDTVLMLDDVSHTKKTEAHLFELERLAERGSMVSSIAHEIRNVLAVLHGGVELAQIVLKRGDTAKVETYLSRVMDSARHLERFAGELIDSKKLEAEKRLGSINDLVTNVATFLRIQRRFKAISLVTELDAAAPPIDMDSDQVSQLLLNLLNNSADAVKETKRPDGLITVRTVLSEDAVTLSITDNGCGISDEVRDKLFQLRFTTKEDGHGYGLVTCARIVANHDAELTVDSKLGTFTTISVAFPLPCGETRVPVQ
jgi:signal transduction histidine kinase